MESFAFHFNLWQLSNASAMWMGMNPPDIFLYIFLPPLLLDSASRIEFFMFRKVPPRKLCCSFLRSAPAPHAPGTSFKTASVWQAAVCLRPGCSTFLCAFRAAVHLQR